MSRPPIESIYDASGGANLPAKYDQNRDYDQGTGDHDADSDAHKERRFCPLCSGA